uniref:Uncharacterized protein n=1 Tax=Lepeophtheirus salmonis TaxID=72036 RepID=A0A0K2U862_LEPSM
MFIQQSLNPDGAPSHSSKIILDFLDSENVMYVHPFSCPPNLLELNPLYYFIWSNVKWVFNEGPQRTQYP